MYEIYRRLPPWHLLAWVYRLPVIRQLFRAGYGLVARNRHRFGRVECADDACEVPYGERNPGASDSTSSSG